MRKSISRVRSPHSKLPEADISGQVTGWAPIKVLKENL